MGLTSGRLTNVQSNQALSKQSKSLGEIAIVYSVVLDETHPLIEEGILTTTDVGSIECRPLSSIQTNELIVARAKNPTNTTLPVRNQTVHITKVGSDYFYDIITKGFSPNTGALPDAIKTTFPGKEKAKDGGNSKDYSNSQKTGIVKSNAEDEQDVEGFGDYFEGQEGIHKLKLYEGDTLFQSRFGQSFRFSGYNNTDNVFSPTITIRNGESALNRQEDVEVVIEEDINRDGSIIQLGSGEYILPFQPGVVDDGGSTDFETSPDSFAEYPSELKGDQILINSGRIILSSKNAEMIFYSKKNYGFISDGTLSIDNKFGIEANVGDDINVLTNDKSINLNTGNGNINLGDQELEPLVKGDTLLGLLEELIDAINAQIYLTPAGPTSGPKAGAGPTNAATFDSIKAKLKNFLSPLNTTA